MEQGYSRRNGSRWQEIGDWPLTRTKRIAAPPSPPGGTEARRHQPILGLDTAPRPLRLMVWACLDRPWSLLPAEPRVRPLVGHFRRAPKGT